MNITLYPLASYNNGLLKPFTVELDGLSEDEYRGLSEDEYRQEIAKGLFEHSSSACANVRSIRCEACGHVAIATDDNECPECGSLTLEVKQTEEEWIVADYEDIPKSLVGEYDIDHGFWDYSELLTASFLDAEVINAGLECGIGLDRIEEAYAGAYASDEDFAQQMAEETGAIDSDASWPQTCIDWEQAAHELMWDYNESGGHYFRIF